MHAIALYNSSIAEILTELSIYFIIILSTNSKMYFHLFFTHTLNREPIARDLLLVIITDE